MPRSVRTVRHRSARQRNAACTEHRRRTKPPTRSWRHHIPSASHASCGRQLTLAISPVREHAGQRGRERRQSALHAPQQARQMRPTRCVRSRSKGATVGGGINHPSARGDPRQLARTTFRPATNRTLSPRDPDVQARPDVSSRSKQHRAASGDGARAQGRNDGGRDQERDGRNHWFQSRECNRHHRLAGRHD